MIKFFRTILAGAVMGVLFWSFLQRRMRRPRRFVSRLAWKAGRDLAPRAANATRVGGRRLARFARRIG